jgi:hypothetical protein
MYSNITTINGETVFLELGGRVEIGRDTEALQTILGAFLGAFVSGEYRWAVFDLAGVAYIDARAVDALAEAIERRSATSVKIMTSIREVRDSIRSKLIRKLFTEEGIKPKAA